MPSTKLVLADRDPGDPGGGNVRSAWRPDAPVIVPPPSERADVPV